MIIYLPHQVPPPMLASRLYIDGVENIQQLYTCSTVLDYLPGGRLEGTECGRGAGGGCRAGGEADGEGKSSSGRQEEFQ